MSPNPDRARWRNTTDRYGIIGQALHWAVVIGLAAAYLIAEAAEDDKTGNLLALHRSVGMAILALAVLRLAWRALDRKPGLPDMPAYQRAAARATHAIFYVLLFALPLTGWMASSAEGEPIRAFGSILLPPIPTAADADALEDLHEVLFNVLLAFAALHTLGALKHHFWDRDQVLRSMLPGAGPRPPGPRKLRA